MCVKSDDGLQTWDMNIHEIKPKEYQSFNLSERLKLRNLAKKKVKKNKIDLWEISKQV